MARDGQGAIRLIVNADDFGASAAVNAGVERACREGIVTSASLMAGGPAFEDAVARVDGLPQLGVGVHLTLSDSRAVLPPGAAPTLIKPDGNLPRNAGAFARAFLSGRISSADVHAELSAQIAKVNEAGVRVTHLDGHQHLHVFSGVADIVVALAREFEVRAVRLSRCRLWPPGRRWLSRQVALRLYAEAFGARARRAGLRMPDGLEGQDCAGALTAERVAAIVSQLEPGTREVMCHPAEEDGEAADGYDRPGELAALTSPSVRAALEERGVRLVNYAAL